MVIKKLTKEAAEEWTRIKKNEKKKKRGRTVMVVKMKQTRIR